MKAVVRLVFTYFSCTAWSRWLTLSSLALFCFATVRLAWFATRDWTWILPFVALAGLFLGSAMMPIVVMRLAGSRHLNALPYGRLKLLFSALLTVLLLSLLPAFPLPLALSIIVRDLDPLSIFWRAYVVAFANLSLLYVVVWTVATRRTAIGRLAGSMLLIAVILGPSGSKFIYEPAASVRWPLLASIAGWGAFCAYFLFESQVRNSVEFLRRLFRPKRYRSGHELELLLSTGQPWALAVIQVVPLIVGAFLMRTPTIWLFYLTIFSAVSGAVTSSAATRSRVIWLRAHYSRAELFACVEKLFWHHNSYSLAVLSAMFVGIGSYIDLSVSTMALGLPLLILGTVVSTYLGLMITRGIGWVDSVLAIVSMLLLMASSTLIVGRPSDMAKAVLGELVLAALAVAYRQAAKHRWANIDWMLCRPERRLAES